VYNAIKKVLYCISFTLWFIKFFKQLEFQTKN